MAKDPAVLWYPNDWLGGTMGMTLEEKGAYHELLMLQFNRGHMPLKFITQTVGDVWEYIKFKFETDEQGLYFNERFDYEIQKRQAHCLKQKENIAKRWNKSGTPVGNTMVLPLENENSNTNNQSKSFIKPTVEEVNSYCIERKNNIDGQSFIDFYDSKGWMIGKNHMKDWKAAVRTWEKHDKGGKQNGLSGDHAKSQGTSRWGNLGGIEV